MLLMRVQQPQKKNWDGCGPRRETFLFFLFVVYCQQSTLEHKQYQHYYLFLAEIRISCGNLGSLWLQVLAQIRELVGH